MSASDYVGIGTLITATAAAVVSVIVALRQTGTHAQIADVQSSVKLSNGHTIGEVIEANDLTGITNQPAPEVEP